MYPLHDRALAYARSQLGVHESPMGSNRGRVQMWHPKGGVDFYQDHDFLPGHGYPWCVSFVLTCWAEGAGRPLPYKTAGAYDMLAWARRAGWTRSTAELVPGDLVVFNVGSGHIAVFEKRVGETIFTVDGNHGNQVARARRARRLVAGGIHIPEKVRPVPHAPKPYWVIATDEHGKRVLLFSKFATEKTILGLLPRLLAKYGRAGITIKRGNEKHP